MEYLEFYCRGFIVHSRMKHLNTLKKKQHFKYAQGHHPNMYSTNEEDVHKTMLFELSTILVQ
jgi:hypothetical protein